MDNKDVKFTEKKIDEGWKERVYGEQGTPQPSPTNTSGQKTASGNQKEDPVFNNFLTSLAMQTLVHLGEIENPVTKAKTQDLEAAKEIIDLMLSLKNKTLGNLSSRETKLMESLLSELQLKYVHASKT